MLQKNHMFAASGWGLLAFPITHSTCLNNPRARPLRLELAGGLYHVVSRGDRREDIYEDDEDREKWLEVFGNACKRRNYSLP